ncbi:MAG: SDR family NAD(P)-dependent oxidoreductase [Pseudomonadota bacterium]
MSHTLILGASGGIGAALMDACPGAVGLSRSGDGLDVTDEGALARLADGLAGPFERIINATGALVIDGAGPEKALSQITPQAMAAQFALNATGPALLLKHFAPLLPRQGRVVFASLSARVGSIGDNHLGGWYSYRAAKAAQNQVIRGAAIELARRNPDSIVVALHPGTVETGLTKAFVGNRPKVTPREAAANLLQVLDGLTPQDTGGFFDQKGLAIEW